MAGFHEEDHAPLADASLLVALVIPFIPIILSLYAVALGALAGCSGQPSDVCTLAGFDIMALRQSSSNLLFWSAHQAASGSLLVYLALLGILAQTTTSGFRGRIVRTFAVILWAGLVPLILGLARVLAHAPERFCGPEGCSPTTILPALYELSRAIPGWLAGNAVPLAVFVTALVALTMVYGRLIGWLIAAFRRDDRQQTPVSD